MRTDHDLRAQQPRQGEKRQGQPDVIENGELRPYERAHQSEREADLRAPMSDIGPCRVARLRRLGQHVNGKAAAARRRKFTERELYIAACGGDATYRAAQPDGGEDDLRPR